MKKLQKLFICLLSAQLSMYAADEQTPLLKDLKKSHRYNQSETYSFSQTVSNQFGLDNSRRKNINNYYPLHDVFAHSVDVAANNRADMIEDAVMDSKHLVEQWNILKNEDPELLSLYHYLDEKLSYDDEDDNFAEVHWQAIDFVADRIKLIFLDRLDQALFTNQKFNNSSDQLVSYVLSDENEHVNGMRNEWLRNWAVTRNKYGVIPLFHAIAKAHNEIVALLLTVPGLPINFQDEAGYTALHAAVIRCHKEIVMLLLATPGIDIDLKDKNERAPLDWAIEGSFTEIIEALVDAGAYFQDKQYFLKLFGELKGFKKCFELLQLQGLIKESYDDYLERTIPWTKILLDDGFIFSDILVMECEDFIMLHLKDFILTTVHQAWIERNLLELYQHNPLFLYFLKYKNDSLYWPITLFLKELAEKEPLYCQELTALINNYNDAANQV